MNLRPFWLLCLLLFLTVKGYGQSAIIEDSSTQILIGKNLQLYKPAKNETIAQVIQARFVPAPTDVPNLGATPLDVWAKVSIHNAGGKSTQLMKIANASLDEAELYTTGPDGVTVTDSSIISKSLPFGARKYKDPNYIFDLHLQQGETRTFYIRVRSKIPIILPVYIIQSQQLLIESARDYMFSGAYLGIIIIMVVYNFFLYLSIRDRSYIYYVFYVLAVGLTQVGLKGYTFQFLWPNAPGFENISMILFACIAGIAALLFSIKFLELRKNFPKLNVVLVVLIGLFCLSLVLLTFNTFLAFTMMQTATSLISIFLVLVPAYVVRKQPSISSARYFLVAWSVLMFGSVIFILKDFSVVPYNTLTNYSVQISSAIEMALLSFGLANRINILKREKDQSRLAALRIAKENSRIIKEQNVVLELKVKERTEELVGINQELNVTLADLKQTQTQLVEAEKMASLGQLTAGIAHEINNPINFVTGNIGPLKRDVDILLQTISMLENFNDQEISDEEKRKKTAAFKDEQDFDYLKTEISHLLKGINEGATRTAEIVKSLRIFSRLDEAELKLADINEGLESTIIIVNNMLGHTVVEKKYGNLPLVHCYPGKLNQVFLNVISNGLFAINEKFGDRSGGILSVATTCDEENVYITIEDNGTGMAAETKRKIFDPFFTTKDVGQGTGLGMSIAFNTIQKHSGQIIVDTEIGKGSRFVLQVPIIMEEI